MIIGFDVDYIAHQSLKEETKKKWLAKCNEIIDTVETVYEWQVVDVLMYLTSDIKFILSCDDFGINLKYSLSSLTAEKLAHDIVFYENKKILERL
jgi:hypothetical protein